MNTQNENLDQKVADAVSAPGVLRDAAGHRWIGVSPQE
jgi:hypothetical protein